MSLRFSPRLLPGDLQGSNDSHSQRDVGSLPFEARAKSMVICRYSQRSKAKEYLASIEENGQCEGDLRRLRAGRVLRVSARTLRVFVAVWCQQTPHLTSSTS
jgi:hypothetical protein